MSKIIILRGLPSSGKSTWALEFIKNNKSFVRINRDSIREQLGREYSKDFERTVKSIRDASIVSALANGFSVIVDDTNLDISNVEQIISLRDSIDSSILMEIKEFTVPLEECLARNERRINKVPAKVIIDMWKKYVKPQMRDLENPTYLPIDPALPHCVVVDMDHTLSLRVGRNPYDYHRVGEDIPHEPVVNIVKNLSKTYPIFIMSGRDDSCKEKTEEWLNKYSIPFKGIFMRVTGDLRKDSIVKEELWRNNIEGRYNVALWIDDRKQVINHMRSLGLPVWECLEGNF